MDPEQVQQIERVLEGSLSEDELDSFRLRLRTDGDLRAEVVSALRLSGLAAAGKNARQWLDELAGVAAALSWAETVRVHSNAG